MTPPDADTSPDRADLAQRLQAALGDGYRVERELGAGGFAVVFLVLDVALKRRLAVKVISPDVVATHTALERFRREAETIAQLSHPHIVPLHFIGDREGLVYLAMAFVDGGALDAWVTDDAKQQRPPAEVRRAMREVASALAHAHKRGVVHRDIKPHNVLVEAESGRCLVTDFGIARTADGTKLTATGMMVGTPAYVAPEQVTGEPSDHRADLYALGIMAWELLTGRPPFEAPTPTAALMKRLGPPPPPVSTVRSGVPRELDAAIRACLEPDPGARVPSADALIAILDGGSWGAEGTASVSSSSTGAAAPAPAATGARVPAWLIAAGALLVLGGGAYAFSQRAGASSSPGATVAARAGAAPALDSTLVAIPGGAYLLGAADAGRAAPAHRVQLESFAIGRHEVTQGEYDAFATATGAPRPWTGAPQASYPVTGVLFAEAANYCRWRHPAGGDLPSEAQWEAAARGTAGRRFPWGDSVDVAAANVAGGGRTAPAPVGAYPRGASPEGVLDLVGNVWEWTRSPLVPYPGGAPLPDSLAQYRVIRGGAWNAPADVATPWFRGYVRPEGPRSALALTGFRCVVPAAR